MPLFRKKPTIVLLLLMLLCGIYRRSTKNFAAKDTQSHHEASNSNKVSFSLSSSTSSSSLSSSTSSDSFDIINIMPWHVRWHTDKTLFWYEEGLGPAVFSSCPNSRCQLVNNLSHSDAVLISGKFLMPFNDSWIKEFKLPSARTQSQKWIFVSNEPPQHRQVATKYLNLFNGTFTYLSDSDVYYPYGYVRKRRSALSSVPFKPGSWRYHPFWLRKQDVAWVVSNCHAASGREHYVKELAKYINVTVFGDCGKNPVQCTRYELAYYNLNCFSKIEHNFKFYLAFENSLCRDYASEKFWRTLQQHMIPVVYGIYNYTRNAPKNSYIDVRDFKNPRELAEYLKKVSANKTLYESYMAWKEKHEVVTNPFYEATCQLCAHLHKTKHDPPKTVDLVKEYLDTNTYCIPAAPFLEQVGVKI